jgi:hypothetical protein
MLARDSLGVNRTSPRSLQKWAPAIEPESMAGHASICSSELRLAAGLTRLS